MTLSEVLKRIDKSSKIAIGTKDGCNFLRIGTAESVKPYLMEFMDRNMVELYPRAGSPIINIIIEGDEAGKYWFESEQDEDCAEVRKGVLCVETGEHFRHACEAARWAGCCTSNITKCLNGESKTAKGYHWKWDL